MKPPLHHVNARLHPGGVWEVYRNPYKGGVKTLFQHPIFKRIVPSSDWVLVRSLPHDPKLCEARLRRKLMEGVNTSPDMTYADRNRAFLRRVHESLHPSSP